MTFLTEMDTDTIDQAVQILNRDLRAAATTLTLNEAQFLVKSYYTMQDYRIRVNNQIRAMVDQGEPNKVVRWYADQFIVMETQVKLSLDKYSNSQPLGQWLRSIVGIGPVIAAGLIAYTEERPRQYAGQLWRYAGLDPTIEWLGREKSTKLVDEIGLHSSRDTVTLDHLALIAQRTNRSVDSIRALLQAHMARKEKTTYNRDDLIAVLARRPWNNDLKVLCWKAGESFVKTQNNENSQYGPYFRKWRELEDIKNAQGLHADEARRILESRKIGKDTDAYAAYSQGKLPKAHLHARARRKTVKLFLSHFHAVSFMLRYPGEPAPIPYVISIMGHQDYVPIPNLDVVGLTDLRQR